MPNVGGTGPVATTDRSLLEEAVGTLVMEGAGAGLEDATVAVEWRWEEGWLAAEAVVVAERTE